VRGGELTHAPNFASRPTQPPVRPPSPRGRACCLLRTPSRSGRVHSHMGLPVRWLPAVRPVGEGVFCPPGDELAVFYVRPVGVGVSIPIWDYRSAGFPRYARSERAYFVPRGDELAVFYARPVGVGVSRFRMGIGLAVLPVGVGVFCPPGGRTCRLPRTPSRSGCIYSHMGLPVAGFWRYAQSERAYRPSGRSAAGAQVGLGPAGRFAAGAQVASAVEDAVGLVAQQPHRVTAAGPFDHAMPFFLQGGTHVGGDVPLHRQFIG
jgi:hypothetical protein